MVITTPLLIIAFLKLYEIRPESANGRLLVWKSAAQMISDNPLTGVGTGQFKANYMHYQAEYLQNNYDAKEALLADNTVFAFNEFICITSELGIPGLFLVLFLLFAIFRKAETDNLSVFIAKSGLMSILVFSLFSYPGSVTSIKVLFVLFVAIVANNQKQLLLPISITGNSLKGIKIVVVSVSTVLLIVSFRNIKEVTVACHNWKTATETITFNKLEQGIKLYEKAYPFLKTDGFFMGMYGNCLLREENYTEAEKILKATTNLLPVSDAYLSLGDCFRAQKQFNNAEKAYKCALQMVPSRIKPVYKLAELYVQTNRQQEALCIIEAYMESEHKKRTIASYEIELNLIELKKEIESFNKT
jgi:tetratricopeptide (TPR) repeat protein